MSENKKKLSITFRMLRKLGFNYSEEAYGQVSIWGVVKRVLKTYKDTFLIKIRVQLFPALPFSSKESATLGYEKHRMSCGKGMFCG